MAMEILLSCREDGSGWVCRGMLKIGGDRASWNSIDINSGATLQSASSTWIGSGAMHQVRNNSIVVSGDGSVWESTGSIFIGAPGSNCFSNQVGVADGGKIILHEGVSIWNSEGAHGNELNINDGGSLTVHSDFDASMSGFNFNRGGNLSVAGKLSGLSMLNSERRLEARDILGDLTVHGTFALGSGSGDSVVRGNLTLADDGTLVMEVGEDGHNLLSVSGHTSLDGLLSLYFSDDFSPTNGASYDLFDWGGGVEGEFSDIESPSLSEGLVWDTSELYSHGTLAVIPEPSSILLILTSGGMLYLRERTRFRRRLHSTSPRCRFK